MPRYRRPTPCSEMKQRISGSRGRPLCCCRIMTSSPGHPTSVDVAPAAGPTLSYPFQPPSNNYFSSPHLVSQNSLYSVEFWFTFITSKAVRIWSNLCGQQALPLHASMSHTPRHNVLHTLRAFQFTPPCMPVPPPLRCRHH